MFAEKRQLILNPLVGSPDGDGYIAPSTGATLTASSSAGDDGTRLQTCKSPGRGGYTAPAPGLPTSGLSISGNLTCSRRRGKIEQASLREMPAFLRGLVGAAGLSVAPAEAEGRGELYMRPEKDGRYQSYYLIGVLDGLAVRLLSIP